jgi:hypothetical protein
MGGFFMHDQAYREGKQAWYDGVGWLMNPYQIHREEEEDKSLSWSQGWREISKKFEEADRIALQKEIEAEYAAEEAARKAKEEIKEKKKTKKGRAELAGQDTLF